MFSKKELEHLRGSLNVSKKYESKLNHLIRKKIEFFCETELPVLQQAEVIGGEASYLARLQSFPDWFIFHGPRTTGGRRRKFECPQYTQVGNAVPPMLAEAVFRKIKGQMKAHRR